MNTTAIKRLRNEDQPGGYKQGHARDEYFWLSEIALQIAEANQLARLRLQLRLAEESIYSPAMRADIVSEVRGELEKS